MGNTVGHVRFADWFLSHKEGASLQFSWQIIAEAWSGTKTRLPELYPSTLPTLLAFDDGRELFGVSKLYVGLGESGLWVMIRAVPY